MAHAHLVGNESNIHFFHFQIVFNDLRDALHEFIVQRIH